VPASLENLHPEPFVLDPQEALRGLQVTSEECAEAKEDKYRCSVEVVFVHGISARLY